jgi:hypothetical protein
MHPEFRDPNYNPMVGAGRTGRVQKDEFSIDGKSWNYRDPYNQAQIRRQNLGNERENDTINEHSSTMTNPLYDYSYGQIRDAAKELGIGNVDEQAEVNELLKYIQKDSDKKPKKDPVEQKAQDFKDDYVDKVITETKQTVGDVSGGNNSIVSPINQDNDIDIAGDSNKVSQDNSIAQMMDKMKQSLRLAY